MARTFPSPPSSYRPRHREAVLAFYRFARAADDIADSATLPPEEKVRRLDLFEATLLGHSDEVAVAIPLRASLAETGVTARHAQDLLVAFRMDATKLRYAHLRGAAALLSLLRCARRAVRSRRARRGADHLAGQ